MDNQNMTYPELRDLFIEHNKTQLAKPMSACIVFAESNWPDRHYPRLGHEGLRQQGRLGR